MFHAWLWFASTLMPGGRLSRRESELVILRVAHMRDCRYELEHHKRLGRRAGIGPEELDRIALGSGADGWTPREKALLTAVEDLHENRTLSDDSWALLRVHVTEPECVELCMLAEHYQMLATVITALRIQPDRPR
jgi:AhpD family alkylhydroperoxidase